jgi:hypothetical protein
MPIWCGLLADSTAIRRAFTWIDAHYSYASGRGGVTFPPFVQQTFIALLDVWVRQQYGLPGAERLLQLILDHALVAGIPLTEWPFGAYRHSGPMHPDWPVKLYRLTHAGRIWDNAPYFGLVFKLHYGLDYNFGGWQIGDPQPLAHYTLTSVRGLRHHAASYDVHWQGRGVVQRILVDDALWPTQQLDLTSGHHTVRVELDEARP